MGITKTSASNGNAKKKSGNKKKSSNTHVKLEERLTALKKAEQDNPFETKLKKPKFTVFAKKEKSTQNVVQARENAVKNVSDHNELRMCRSSEFIVSDLSTIDARIS
jgi:hypothetical protein